MEDEASTSNLLEQTIGGFLSDSAHHQNIHNEGFRDCKEQLLELKKRYSPQQFQWIILEAEEDGKEMRQE